jgi:polyhydroxybutyrate depolymerase
MRIRGAVAAAWVVGCAAGCNAPHVGILGVDATGGSAAPPTVDAPGAAASCAGRTAQPLDATWTITVAGAQRTADVHVPASYDPTTPTAVVLDFHGLGGTAAQEAALTGANAEADAQGFVSVHPQSATNPGSWNAGSCCGTASLDNIDDMSYVTALLDQLDAQLCVDDNRVFSMGMSNGAYMSHRLGCELADRIAAIGPVAGAIAVATCTPSRPVPVFEVHGNADPIVPYAYGQQSVADWVALDGCTTTATTYQNGAATCVTNGGCTVGADVTFCTIAGGGHQWPGGETIPLLGSNTTDLDATDALWTFFAAHPEP